MKLQAIKLILVTALVTLHISLYSQVKATESPAVLKKGAETKSDTLAKRSPRKAALYSALLPGAGQVYNKKYWKVPLIIAWEAAGILGAIRFHNEMLYELELVNNLDADQKELTYYQEVRNSYAEMLGRNANDAEMKAFLEPRIIQNDIVIKRYQNSITRNSIDGSRDSHLANANENRRFRDLFFILTGVGYFLNVLDAAVDAHMSEFDVNDKISMNIKPLFHYRGGNSAVGVSLAFGFR